MPPILVHGIPQNTPNRNASSAEVDAWNQAWRQSPLYAEILRRVGVDPSRPVHLSDRQREDVEKMLRSQAIPMQNGMHIDPAGNLNQTNRSVRNAAIIAALAAAGGYAALPLMAGGAGATTGAGGLTGLGGLGGGEAFALGGTGGEALAGLGGLAGGEAAAGGGGFWSGLGNALRRFAGGGGGNDGGGGTDWLSLLTNVGSPLLSSQANARSSARQAEVAAQIQEEQFNAQRRNDLWSQLLQREQDQRTGMTDAWKKLQQSEYVAGGGRPYTPPSWGTAFGFGPTAPSAATQEGARALSDRSGQYLREGTSLTPTAPKDPFQIDRSLLEPGTAETIMGAAGAGLGGYNAWAQLQNQQRQSQQNQQQQQRLFDQLTQQGGSRA